MSNGKKKALVLVYLFILSYAGFSLMIIVGVCMKCMFVDGCYQRFGIFGAVSLIRWKDVFINGTFLGIGFSVHAWAVWRNAGF